MGGLLGYDFYLRLGSADKPAQFCSWRTEILILRRPRLVALMILNVAILLAIIALPLTRRADGQDARMVRSHATYSMAGGNVGGFATGAIYIVDETHDEMISLMWNDKSKVLTSIGYRNLAADGGASARPQP